MAFGTPYRPRFGLPAPAEEEEDDPEDAADAPPPPITVKMAARRVAGIKEAKAILTVLPTAGESLHALCTARMDLTDVIGHLLERHGVCERMLIATLGYNERNLATVLGWLDEGKVKSLQLLTSIFFRSHKPPLFSETVLQFGKRQQPFAAAHSHAKVVTMEFTDGAKLVIEGSANLAGNGSGREQFMLCNDSGLHDWHAKWVGEMVSKNATQAKAEET